MNKQPNSRDCFVCGLENPYGLQLKFYKTGPKEVTVNYTVPDQFQGYPGTVHGGIVAALLDETLGRVQMTSDPKDTRFMYTARLTIRYRKNVPVGQPLQIVARALKTKNRTAAATASIYGPDGDVLAEAEAILVNVPEEMLSAANLEALGWDVYPD